MFGAHLGYFKANIGHVDHLLLHAFHLIPENYGRFPAYIPLHLREQGAAAGLFHHYYAVAGYRLQLSDPLFEILPSAIIKSDGRTNSFDVSALVRYNKKFWGGVSFRAGDAFAGIIGFELFNGIRIGYSYDFNTSSIGNYSKGSHEFTLGYCFTLSLDKAPQKYRSIRFL